MRRSTVLLIATPLLLAASPATTRPPAPEAATPRASAAVRARLAKELQVDSRTLDESARHLILSEAVKQAPTEAGLCSLLSSASALHARLGARLSETRDRLFALPPPREGEADQLQAFGERMERADALMPGIALRVGAESLSHSVHYGELARLAPQGSAAQRLLEAVGSIWAPPAGWPVYIEPQTDVSGCWKPGALVEPLRQTGAAWGEAHGCLQQLLTPVVQGAMQQALHTTCFCDGKAHVQRQLQQLATAYETLALPDAKQAAAGARRLGQSTQVRFDCK